jgi:hypothetical protein
MRVYVFVGPSLPRTEALAVLDATYLPPVSQGDVYRVSLRRPCAIGIVDGYFDRVPAVWHKEILWAMAQGIHVFGSASMGALRAAELSSFGMEGVGAIFEAYRDGVLEADDEVAVVHGAAETGYRPMSEAMVNIRRTLADAETAGAVSAPTRAALEGIARALHYTNRSYGQVLERAKDMELPETELRAFREWLPRGRADQKRDDALAMLRLIRERLEGGLPPKQVSYTVEPTDVWDEARRLAGAIQEDGTGDAETILVDRLLDELRLERGAYGRAFQGTMARLLAIEESRRQGFVADAQMLADVAERVRDEQGLVRPEDVLGWQTAHHLTGEQFTRLMEDETRLRWVETLSYPEVVRLLPDHLRVSGEYGRLSARARDKQRTLERIGLARPRLEDAGLSERALMRWYFVECLGYPATIDGARYASAIGFADLDAFRLAILREYCYVRAVASQGAGAVNA